ncbi:MAG: peptidylprolyl isomerase [Nitrospirae bacterium]|nr:peptidylprolyl isomerase [Nitrospirota bacterium]
MKRTLLKAFLIIPVLLWLLTGIQPAFCSVLLDRIVATVNNEVITWSELMNVIIIDERQSLGGLSGEAREKKIKEAQRPVLNNLIEMKLQLQEAGKMALDVNVSEIDGAIQDIRTKYNLSEEMLINSLKAEGLTQEDYRARLADQILLQKVINYAVRNNIVVSDKEIEQYYDHNKGEFDTEEKIRISQIFIALPRDSSGKEAAEAKAREIAQKIKSGENFAKLAGEFSEDPSRAFGGDLGYISRGSAMKEIEDAAAVLKKGEVSSPFWSPAGLHIIKLEDRIEGGGLDKVRNKIREALLQKAFEGRYRDWKAGLREKAFIEIKL